MDDEDGWLGMNPDCHDLDAATTDVDWLVLKRLKGVKASAVAVEMGIDPATLSNFVWGKGGLKPAQIRSLLKALGLRIVDGDAVVMPAAQFREMARQSAILYAQAPHLLLRTDE